MLCIGENPFIPLGRVLEPGVFNTSSLVFVREVAHSTTPILCTFILSTSVLGKIRTTSSVSNSWLYVQVRTMSEAKHYQFHSTISFWTSLSLQLLFKLTYRQTFTNTTTSLVSARIESNLSNSYFVVCKYY